MAIAPTPAELTQAFLRKSSALVVSEYLPKIERSLAGLTDEDIWWRPNETSNSIGNLLLHLCGNVTQWIIGGVGGRDYARWDPLESTCRHASLSIL